MGTRCAKHEIGLWARRFTRRHFPGSPYLFLDRDGVIVEETHYLHRAEDVAFTPGVIPAIAEVNCAGIPVVVVTNQAGIGRGYYDWNAFSTVQQRILDDFGEQDAQIDLELACAYHADGIGAYSIADHPWRKPRPGMLVEAAHVLGVDLKRSIIVGDKISDLEAGMAAGVPHGALTLTGHGRREYAKHETTLCNWSADGRFHVRVVDNAAVAIQNWLKRISVTASYR